MSPLVTDPAELRLTVDAPKPDIQAATVIPGQKVLPPFPETAKLREVHAAAVAYAASHGDKTLLWALTEALEFAEHVENTDV